MVLSLDTSRISRPFAEDGRRRSGRRCGWTAGCCGRGRRPWSYGCRPRGRRTRRRWASGSRSRYCRAGGPSTSCGRRGGPASRRVLGEGRPVGGGVGGHAPSVPLVPALVVAVRREVPAASVAGRHLPPPPLALHAAVATAASAAAPPPMNVRRCMCASRCFPCVGRDVCRVLGVPRRTGAGTRPGHDRDPARTSPILNLVQDLFRLRAGEKLVTPLTGLYASGVFTKWPAASVRARLRARRAGPRQPQVQRARQKRPCSIVVVRCSWTGWVSSGCATPTTLPKASK